MTLLTVEEVRARLRMSRSTFYARRAQLVAAGVLVQALPQLTRQPLYLAEPVADYETGAMRRTVLRQATLGRGRRFAGVA